MPSIRPRGGCFFVLMIVSGCFFVRALRLRLRGFRGFRGEAPRRGGRGERGHSYCTLQGRGQSEGEASPLDMMFIGFDLRRCGFCQFRALHSVLSFCRR